MSWLGIDFGTSNTAAAVLQGRAPRRIVLENGEDTIPTAIFLDFAARRTLYGRAAVAAMIDGREGRFMRALKSILGTPLARERRQFLNERLTLIDIIARFLRHVKEQAEAQEGRGFTRVLSGRPVHFHSRDAARDAQAEADLTEAYRLAGFSEIRFLPEPEAAALAAQGAGLGLIVDIGGGTSDFTLFDASGAGGQGGVHIRASHGVRIGGTDFDRTLSVAHVMPLLGLGGLIRAELGAATHPAPRALFHDLASWEKIPFVYDAKLLRDVRRWEKLAQVPRLFARLGDVLEYHLGHDIAFAVEAGKIAANDGAEGRIDLTPVETGLGVALSPGRMTGDLAGFSDQISQAARDTLTAARVPPADVGRIVFVGGSSLMQSVQQPVRTLLPDACAETGDVFTAVVDGLALASA